MADVRRGRWTPPNPVVESPPAPDGEPTFQWDLGHVGDNTGAGGERCPEHRSCNRATITNLRQKLAEAEAAPRGSREW